MTLFPHVSSTEKVILHPDLENVPLLILANKQDRMVGKFTLSVIWLQLTSQECLPLFYSDTDSSSLVACSLGPRPKINPSAFSIAHVVLEVIYAPDEVWGRD